MKKITLLVILSSMLICGQAQIISAIVHERAYDTGLGQVKLYTSPFRDAWPGLTFGDPGVSTATWIGSSQITANDTMVLLTTIDDHVVLWKNGGMIDISGEKLGVGTALFIQQEDIYVLWNNMFYPYCPAYIWKNGETYCEIKSQDYSYATTMYVTDSNLYVAGYSAPFETRRRATLWTNGDAQYLSDTLYESAAYSMVVSDSNVYIVGYGINFNGIKMAKVWINGVESNLSTGEYNTQPWSVCVDGQDVYVVGQEDIGPIPKPVFWKNGVKHQLSNQSGSARSVRMFGEDVYVGGSVNGIATIWKNGIEIEEFTNLYSMGIVMDLFIFPDSTSKVNDFKQPLFKATLYPNPATHHVTIDMPSDIPSAQFFLFDMYGKLLLQKQVQNGEKVNLPDLSSGIYLYQVDSEKGRATGKVVVSYE